MAFQFKRKETTEEGLRRIAREQIERALEEIDAAQLDQSTKIHQVRKRCKKLRGLIRLVRPALGKTYKHENASLRDTARLLSDLRDANISLQTFQALIEDCGADAHQFLRIGERLQQDQYERTGDGQTVDSALQRVRQRLADTSDRVGQWSLQSTGFEAIGGGWKRTYTAARRALRKAQAQRSAEALHVWRKEVKYHGYQCRLLEAVWPVMLEARSDEAGRLGDWLGADHDLAVLCQQLLEQPERYGDSEPVDALSELIDRRRQWLQRRCFRLGKQLFAEDKASFARRYQRYWKVWRKR